MKKEAELRPEGSDELGEAGSGRSGSLRRRSLIQVDNQSRRVLSTRVSDYTGNLEAIPPEILKRKDPGCHHYCNVQSLSL
jgi:hypothetical protein